MTAAAAPTTTTTTSGFKRTPLPKGVIYWLKWALGIVIITLIGLSYYFFSPHHWQIVGTNRYSDAETSLVSQCPGTAVHKDLSVGEVLNVNPACQFTFGMTSGKAHFTGDGVDAIWVPDTPPIGEVKGRTREVQALVAGTGIDYMLCSTERTVVGWECL